MTPEPVGRNRILVDTDVVFYIFRGDTRADYFRPYLLHRTLAVSFMTVAELYYGAYKAGWGTNQVARLENHLRNYTVVPYDFRVCQQWARVRAQRERIGHQISVADAWQAACALTHECALATNNGRDFQDIEGLKLIAPELNQPSLIK